MENILGKQKNLVLLVFMSPGLDRVDAWQLCRMNSHIIHPFSIKHHLNKRLCGARREQAEPRRQEPPVERCVTCCSWGVSSCIEGGKSSSPEVT